MTSLFAETVRRTCARTARWVGAFVAGACIAACAGGGALAQTSGKNPEFSNSSRFAGQRWNQAGRNAQYGDGSLDPPAGMRGPIKNHPEYPIPGNISRARAE